jgi:hypothetical protein
MGKWATSQNDISESSDSKIPAGSGGGAHEVEVVSTERMADNVYNEILTVWHDPNLVKDEDPAGVNDARGMCQELLRTCSQLSESMTDPLPCLVILRTKGVHKIWAFLSAGNVKRVHLELCCEHPDSPHRIEEQTGMSLTSLSASLRNHLDRALPWINGVFGILTAGAQVGLNSVAPPAGSFIPDNMIRLPGIKAGQEHPMVAPRRSENMSTRFYANNTTPERYREWQKCFKAILTEKYGLDLDIDQAMARRFLLYSVKYKAADGIRRVAWLCDEHYREHINDPS